MSPDLRTAGATEVAIRYSLPSSTAAVKQRGSERVREQRARASELVHAALGAVPSPDPAAEGAQDTLRTDEHGAPLPTRGRYWSKADSRGAVLVAAAAAPVGVDVERFGRLRLGALAERYGDEAEDVTGAASEGALLSGWCSREAVLKLRGIGLAGLARTRWTALELLSPASDSASPDLTSPDLTPSGPSWPGRVTDAIATLLFDRSLHRVRLARRGAFLFAVACDACDPALLDFRPATPLRPL